jgi:hypothetical protein
MILEKGFLTFDEGAHTYTDPNGEKYTSVSRLIQSITPPFPRDAISRSVAKRDGRTQDEVLKEWDDKMHSSIARGNVIHNALEEYDKFGSIVDESMESLIKGINSLFIGYTEKYSEEILFSKNHKIAGTADKVCYRGKRIFDVFDYKTNESKGIEFFSPYDKFLLEPFSHLEYCNYVIYSLQLSCYAYMINMAEYGIGRLAIIYIPASSSNTYRVIPVPYMKLEAEALFNLHVKKNNIVSYKEEPKILW